MTTRTRTETIGRLLLDEEKRGDLTIGAICERLGGISRGTYISWKRGALMGDEYVGLLHDYLGIPKVEILLARYSTFEANPRSIKSADIERPAECPGENCPNFIGDPGDCLRADTCPKVPRLVEDAA